MLQLLIGTITQSGSSAFTVLCLALGAVMIVGRSRWP
jgi:hypothetical protein